MQQRLSTFPELQTQKSFESVAKVVFDRACQLIIGGNPAFESEKVLFHLEMVMQEWGYKSAVVAEYCDSVKEENDVMREMGIE
ncbi:hypothetical protein [Acinetobacter sp. CFCC 10889]|uniref:hypothetical protein n=1 Tax=Acinetobacter sp. CFCC 10889 TaxID=1775557 RepID=UPI000DCFBC79|nr:hypothetical protein [Acinetobacter sp. CFCC 10889]